ncbi:MAG TPA: type VI secretion system ATPase TssH, partial [Geomonas sp.]
IVIYRALPLDRIKEIVVIQLKSLLERLGDKGMGLEVTDKAREYIAHEGYDPAYGARPLKRALQRKIQDPLALMLLEGKFAPGDTVQVDLSMSGDSLVIKKK